MTRKEIEKIVADNPGKPLYAEYIGGTLPGGATFGLMHEVYHRVPYWNLQRIPF